MYMKTYKINVKGLVQGVGFRYYCFKIAIRYNIKGYVKNLFDGNVEIVAEGDENLLAEFVKSIKIGPRFSKVESIDLIEIKQSDKYKEFSIK